MKQVGVLGASGFVGASVMAELGATGRGIRTPRTPTSARRRGEFVTALEYSDAAVRTVAESAEGCLALVVASGLADAAGRATDGLYGANTLVPLVAAEAARRSGCSRLVHISSAVVQGNAQVLNSDKTVAPVSPYSASKALGEECLLRWASEHPDVEVVIYRPPSVHAPSRRVTRSLAALARSPFASVASPGTAPTPQALLENVASAVTYLATCSQTPPQIVHHPWENVTVASLMSNLGGRNPAMVPLPLARWAARAARAICLRIRPLMPHARRLELLWLGQDQARSWLSSSGWTPPAGLERWVAIGVELRHE